MGLSNDMILSCRVFAKCINVVLTLLKTDMCRSQPTELRLNMSFTGRLLFNGMISKTKRQQCVSCS